jgi:hypothetical protein
MCKCFNFQRTKELLIRLRSVTISCAARSRLLASSRLIITFSHINSNCVTVWAPRTSDDHVGDINHRQAPSPHCQQQRRHPARPNFSFLWVHADSYVQANPGKTFMFFSKFLNLYWRRLGLCREGWEDGGSSRNQWDNIKRCWTVVASTGAQSKCWQTWYWGTQAFIQICSSCNIL